MSRERKTMLSLVAALLIVAVAMYGWKVGAVEVVENRLPKWRRNRPKRTPNNQSS